MNKGHLADDMIKLLNTIAYVLGWIVGRVTGSSQNIWDFCQMRSKSKEVSVLPQQVKTGIPIIDKIQAANMATGAPAQLTSRADGGRSRLQKSRGIDKVGNYDTHPTTNTFHASTALPGMMRQPRISARLAEIAAEEANQEGHPPGGAIIRGGQPVSDLTRSRRLLPSH